MKKEELISFPAIRPSVVAPIAQIYHDHDGHDDRDGRLRAVARIADGFTAPRDLQNDVPFPRFGQSVGSRGQTKGHVS